MFDILMYLFENYIHSEAEVMVDHDVLTDELTRAGFHQDEIYKALAWLEKLAALQDSEIYPYLTRTTSRSIRIYTQEEMQLLDVECRGFLMFLEQVNVLEFSTREMVIDRVMELDTEHFSIDDLKWVVLMVLFNVPGKENAYSQMEDLIFDEQEGPLH
ncbi:MAG: Smg protein [Alteromonadaceae bacterium]|jgi:Smg protein